MLAILAINSVHSSFGIKCNDKVRDHEKIMYYMCLNKPHSQDICFSAPTQPAGNELHMSLNKLITNERWIYSREHSAIRVQTKYKYTCMDCPQMGTFMNRGDFVLATFTLTLHAVW